MRFTLWSFHSSGASDALMVCRRRCSSGSKSVVDVPASTLPRRSTALDRKSIASTSEVFPVPPWPPAATLRIRSAGDGFTDQSPHPPRGAARGRRPSPKPPPPPPAEPPFLEPPHQRRRLHDGTATDVDHQRRA